MRPPMSLARVIMNVGSIEGKGTLPALEGVAKQFAALCDRATQHGLLVALEFLPWSDISDARVAWGIVRQADRGNGGILIDSWHYFRGVADPTQLRAIPADRVVAIQFEVVSSSVSSALRKIEIRRKEKFAEVFQILLSGCTS